MATSEIESRTNQLPLPIDSTITLLLNKYDFSYTRSDVWSSPYVFTNPSITGQDVLLYPIYYNANGLINEIDKLMAGDIARIWGNSTNDSIYYANRLSVSISNNDGTPAAIEFRYQGISLRCPMLSMMNNTYPLLPLPSILAVAEMLI